MRIRWRGLELPSQVELDDAVSTERYGRFIIEPFERGFGTTVGNSLRRVLLSSLRGAAVTSVKIAGVAHEFTTIRGVLEDVTDIILNVKNLVVGLDTDEPKGMSVTRNTRGEVRARDIIADPAVTIVNPDLLLATLTDDVEFRMEMTLRSGRGYATAEENMGPEQEIGVIPVDSVFSPVERVRYRTEETRVGQRTNYDRLILEVWTRGTILPADALVEAAKILRKHLNPFVMYHELGKDMVSEMAESAPVTPDHVAELQGKLSRPVSDLELSVRASNCLEAARIETVSELVQKTDADLLRVRSFGKTSLREVKRKLTDWGLSLGMTLNENGTIASMPAPSLDEGSDDARVAEQVGNMNL
jgi:DNA-directed RNA polymerase subunit alpha